ASKWQTTISCFRRDRRNRLIVSRLSGMDWDSDSIITSFAALTAGKAEATELAKGIGEALIATGGGLLLAIPSMFLYFFFRGQVSTNMADVHKTLSHIHHKIEGLPTLITR